MSTRYPKFESIVSFARKHIDDGTWQPGARQCALRCNAEVAAALGLERGATVYHSLIVHLADDEAVQLEYRFVRPDGAPGYLEADLTLETPNHYLQRVCPLAEARQDICAAMPRARQCQLLGIRRTQPCLVIIRTTASRRGLVSFARILAPASRYRLSGRLHFTNRIGK